MYYGAAITSKNEISRKIVISIPILIKLVSFPMFLWSKELMVVLKTVYIYIIDQYVMLSLKK